MRRVIKRQLRAAGFVPDKIDSTAESIVDDYPELELEDIRACLAYAHAAIAGERIEQVTVAAE